MRNIMSITFTACSMVQSLQHMVVLASVFIGFGFIFFGYIVGRDWREKVLAVVIGIELFIVSILVYNLQ